jgi:hypothetical protein
MPIYEFKHPETDEIFEDIRPFSKMEDPFIAPDGVECERIQVPKSLECWAKNREVFEADPAYVKSCRTKYVQFQDGHKEKYDPTKHC